jgi:hypothetical protein
MGYAHNKRNSIDIAEETSNGKYVTKDKMGLKCPSNNFKKALLCQILQMLTI